VLNSSNGDRDDVSNVVIIITDGGSNEDEDLVPIEAELLKRQADVFAVGIVTEDFDYEELTVRRILTFFCSLPTLTIFCQFVSRRTGWAKKVTRFLQARFSYRRRVCPFVRLSVTPLYYVKTTPAKITKSSLWAATRSLFFVTKLCAAG